MRPKVRRTLVDGEVAPVAKDDGVGVLALSVVADGALAILAREGVGALGNVAGLSPRESSATPKEAKEREREGRRTRSNHSFSILSMMTSKTSYEMGAWPSRLRSALSESSQSWSVARTKRRVNSHGRFCADAVVWLTLLVHVVFDLLCELCLEGFCGCGSEVGVKSARGQRIAGAFAGSGSSCKRYTRGCPAARGGARG